jgi:uncharacterized membrane protein
MPFCAKCGAAVDGQFCPKCGTPMGAAPASNPPPAPGAVTVIGLDDNLAGALCYLGGFITGIIFLLIEPYNRRPFVRFHAFQSIFLCVAWIILAIAFRIPFIILGAIHSVWLIFLPLRMVFGLLGFLLWLFCMYKAYNREWFQLPIIGPAAAKQAPRP